jgi:hypothetical protein
MYNLFGLPLLPLIGGYIFLANFNLTKHRTYHYSGYKLLFYSAAVGLIGDFVVSVGQALLEISVSNYHPWFIAISSFFRILDKPNPEEVLVLLLLCTSWIFLNQLPFLSSGKALNRAVFHLGTPLEKLLLEAQIDEQLVSISLKNDKVYIGFVIEPQVSFRPYSTQEGYITILPIISGYREAVTKEFKPITRYYEVIYDADLLKSNAMTQKDFHLAVPEREIITINKFDYNAFQAFKVSDQSR